MANQFNADEIFDMAERIEKNGAKFYRNAASKFDDQKTKRVLEELAAMEDEHQMIFTAMKESYGSNETYDPDGAVKEYLGSLADKKIFNLMRDPNELLSGDETLTDIFKIALGLERDSVMFYLGMKDMMPEKLGKDKIDHIIKEEMSHITILTKELNLNL